MNSNAITGKFDKKIRGVNLGGWLVLEKWMTPSLFYGTRATDETTLCVELGDKAGNLLSAHRETFITERDFAWLAVRGINTVRIPVGFWIFGPPYPYHEKYNGNTTPFVEGSLNYLDRAFEWADKHGLHVLIDLHAAPGCQNGFDNGGMKGVNDWQRKEEYIDFTLDILEHLAERYKGRKALHGIEVLNEPLGEGITAAFLKDFTLKAYYRIRQHCPPEEAAVVFHDGFKGHKEYLGFPGPELENVVFDIHRYQCFELEDRALDIGGHIQKSAINYSREADSIQKELGLASYVGEWSLGLDVKVVNLWSKPPYNNPLEGMDSFQQNLAYRAYGSAQLCSFEKHAGWFFWSYKTETTPAWCFRECVEKGWLPADFR